MELFRVVREKYHQDLSGEGAFRYGGRWNTKERYALYTASSRSLGILETLVHLHTPRPPEDYVIVVLYVPDHLAVQNISLSALSQNWREQHNETQQMGNTWLAGAATPLLRIPSVIVPSEYNFMLNPRHADYKELKIIQVEPLTFDTRFF
jgi:RES domain-containing protein